MSMDSDEFDGAEDGYDDQEGQQQGADARTIQVQADWVDDQERAAYEIASRYFPEGDHRTDLRGGVEIMYVEGDKVISRANEAFVYGWDFEIMDSGINEDADEAWVRGRVTVWRPVQEQTIVITDTTDSNGVTTRSQVTTYATRIVPVRREQYGSQKLKRARSTGKILDIGFDLKGAATDCLKKCWTLMGIALYLSNKEERALMALAMKESQEDHRQDGGNGQGQPPQGGGRFRRFGNNQGGNQSPPQNDHGNNQGQQAMRINGIEMPIGFEMPFALVMNRQDDNECRAKGCSIVVNPEATYKIGPDNRPGSYVIDRAKQEAGCVLCVQHTSAWFRAKNAAKQNAA